MPYSRDDGLDAVKILALVLMITNHVLLAYPDWRVLGHLLGRPCIPVFAYIMLERLSAGDASRSKRMLVRLFLWGGVAQIPYQLLFDGFPFHLNVLFMLGAGAGLIRLTQLNQYKLLALAAVVLIFFSDRLDGGALIPMSMLVGYWVYRSSKGLALSIVVLAAAIANLMGPLHWEAVPTTLLALPLVLVSPTLSRFAPSVPGYLFYVLYPSHLLLIWVVFGPYIG